MNAAGKGTRGDGDESTEYCVVAIHERVLAQCLKIPQNVAFSNTRQIDWFWHFELLSNQNVNAARFARNVEWDFFCDFQPLCSSST